jgi:hypothetical protein
LLHCRNEQEQLLSSQINTEKYTLLPPCGRSCRRKCFEKTSMQQRSQINRSYWLEWSLKFGEQQILLDGHSIVVNNHKTL